MHCPLITQRSLVLQQKFNEEQSHKYKSHSLAPSQRALTEGTFFLFEKATVTYLIKYETLYVSQRILAERIKRSLSLNSLLHRTAESE